MTRNAVTRRTSLEVKEQSANKEEQRALAKAERLEFAYCRDSKVIELVVRHGANNSTAVNWFLPSNDWKNSAI